MEVQEAGKTYATSFFEPADQTFIDNFETKYEDCLEINNVKATDQNPFEL